MTETINRLRFPILLATILALLALSGAVALPATAQAQSVTTLVSNIDQNDDSSVSNIGASGVGDIQSKGAKVHDRPESLYS